MPLYRIHRLRESARQSFRWAPHTAGLSTVKPKDYQQEGTVEALTPYAAWLQLREDSVPLQVGDLLEQPDGLLCICKYVGFEEARWLLPEAKAELEAEPVISGQPSQPDSA